mgnify:CR=1 FL=1
MFAQPQTVTPPEPGIASGITLLTLLRLAGAAPVCQCNPWPLQWAVMGCAASTGDRPCVKTILTASARNPGVCGFVCILRSPFDQFIKWECPKSQATSGFIFKREAKGLMYLGLIHLPCRRQDSCTQCYPQFKRMRGTDFPLPLSLLVPLSWLRFAISVSRPPVS